MVFFGVNITLLKRRLMLALQAAGGLEAFFAFQSLMLLWCWRFLPRELCQQKGGCE